MKLTSCYEVTACWLLTLLDLLPALGLAENGGNHDSSDQQLWSMDILSTHGKLIIIVFITLLIAVLIPILCYYGNRRRQGVNQEPRQPSKPKLIKSPKSTAATDSPPSQASLHSLDSPPSQASLHSLDSPPSQASLPSPDTPLSQASPSSQASPPSHSTRTRVTRSGSFSFSTPSLSEPRLTRSHSLTSLQPDSTDATDSLPTKTSWRSRFSRDRSPSPHRPSSAGTKQKSRKLQPSKTARLKSIASNVSKRVKSLSRKQDEYEVTVKVEIKERKKDVKPERHNAELAVDYVLKKTELYQIVTFFPDMGSRMQKYWFKVIPSDCEGHTNPLVLTIGPIPRRCPLLPLEEKTMKTLNELMKTIQVHPFLQPVEYVHYLSDRKQVIIVQPFSEQGSLKDLIYNDKPTNEWSDKYQLKGQQCFTTDQIALYGRQIAEAMVFLVDSFKSRRSSKFILGHVQSGNIFVQDGVCRLGGYENTLLGYRSRFYRMCQDHLEHMDVIMFGHLVFEMSCAYELTTVFPTEQDYQAVKDERIKDFLNFNFGHQKAQDKKLSMSTILMFILFCLNQLVIGYAQFVGMATVVMGIEITMLLIAYAIILRWSKSHDTSQEVKVQFPSIHEVKEHLFFKSESLPYLDNFNRSKMKLEVDMKELLVKVENSNSKHYSH